MSGSVRISRDQVASDLANRRLIRYNEAITEKGMEDGCGRDLATGAEEANRLSQEYCEPFRQKGRNRT